MKIINAGNRIMNTYFYPSSSGLIMIDTGYEHSLESVEKKLKQHNLSLKDVSYVFLTHAHDDHAGFLNEMLHQYDQFQVIISSQSKKTLKRGQNSFEGGCSTLFAWLFCQLMVLFGKGEHRFPMIEDQFDSRFIEVTDQNKDELERLLGASILYTPGHTCDSLSLKYNDVLFCGDAAMNGLPSFCRLIIWIENLVQYEQSWDIMIHTDAEWIYPAHGKPFLKEDLKKFKSMIKKVRLYKLK
ncbi:MAG: MBL fold metallo-hydrolase [Erysipelotrichaceae bacterium]|nr:MBL fold metallo-hydrolase [Erysipelotrichaceae bacterium]